jgi:hypothetical protein
MPDELNSPVQACPFKAEKKPEPDPKKIYWIKFKIVHFGDKEPLEGVVLDLKLPDENFTVLSSDEKGLVEINHIDDGFCHLNVDWKELINMGYTIDQMVIIDL